MVYTAGLVSVAVKVDVTREDGGADQAAEVRGQRILSFEE